MKPCALVCVFKCVIKILTQAMNKDQWLKFTLVYFLQLFFSKFFNSFSKEIPMHPMRGPRSLTPLEGLFSQVASKMSAFMKPKGLHFDSGSCLHKEG